MKMITHPVDFSAFRNDEIVSFAEETVVQAAAASEVVAGLGPLAPAYMEATENLRSCLNVLSGCPEVAGVRESDSLRDRKYASFVSLVRAMTTDDDPETAAAAQQVMDIVSRIPNPTQLGDNTETSKINTLVENLQPYVLQIERIGAATRFQGMDQANRDFARIQDARYTAESAKASGNMKSAVAQWKPVYKSLVQRVNALIEVHGETSYKQFADAHNQAITHYRNIIKQRRGKGRSGNKGDEK